MVATVTVLDEVEHEDGSCTYTFEFDDSTAKKLQGLGLELILYCAIARKDVQEVFDYLTSFAEVSEENYNG